MKNREKKVSIGAFLILGLLIIQCTVDKVHKDITTSPSKECTPIILTEADTFSYTILFSDHNEKKRFIGSFNDFLKKYPFSTVKYDSINSAVYVKILPFYSKETSPALSPLEQPLFTESIRGEKDTTLKNVEEKKKEDIFLLEEDTIIPESGGVIKIWSDRKDLDEVFFPIIVENPFSSFDTSEPIFEISIPSEKKISIQLKKKIYDSKGKVISALDIIDSWTEYIKNYPAEGLALFRYVEGIKEFIEGKEVTIRGINATDQRNIILRLSKPDEFAIERIKSIRLAGGMYSRMGNYCVSSLQKEQVIFLPTKKEIVKKLLDTLVISFEEDKNSLLSFSLKKYNAVTIFTVNDLNYARTTLQKSSNLYPLSKERYFIGCRSGFEGIGKIIASKLNREDLLKSVIMAEGEIINLIESDSYEDSSSIIRTNNIPNYNFSVGKIRIICRKDDIPSVKIGEKILAILLNQGISSELLSLDRINYERALVSHNYECAVGWVSEKVKNTISEKLRLSTIWFEDKQEEKERVASFAEIPLFSLNRYILFRKPAGLYRGYIGGVYASYKSKE